MSMLNIFHTSITDKVKKADLGLTRLEIQKLDRVVQHVKKFIQPGMLRQFFVKKFKKRKLIDTFFYHSVFTEKKNFLRQCDDYSLTGIEMLPLLDFSLE